MANFLRIKSVKQLQQILRDREVSFANHNKAVLVDLCQAALELNTPLDPDGIFEDRESVISSKLTTPTNIILTNPQLILDYTHNLSVLPALSIKFIIQAGALCTLTVKSCVPTVITCIPMVISRVLLLV